MTTKPLPKPKPLTARGFHVRADGVWQDTNLHEGPAWGLFLTECRAGRFVELLRGKVVVAYSGKGLFR